MLQANRFRIKPSRAMALSGVAMMVTGSLGITTRAGAETVTLGSYRVATHGDAVQFTFVDEGAPVFPGGEVLASSPATAAAFVDSTGQSSAFASAPYPGQTWISFPGTYNGVRPPGSPEAPPYPWYVSSNHPGNPEAKLEQGPVALEAKSAADTSASKARSGAVTSAAAQVATATANSLVAVDQAAANVTAATDVTVDGFALGPEVSFGHLSGRAKLSSANGAAPVKESAFEVASFTVGGQRVAFTDEGFVVGGSPGQPVDTAPVDTITSPAGAKVTYLPAVETPTSVESAGFSIAFRQTVPNQGVVGITMTFGRVKAVLEALAAPPDLGSADVSLPSGPAGGTDGGGSTAVASPGGDILATLPSTGAAAATSTGAPAGGFFRSGPPPPAAGPEPAALGAVPAPSGEAVLDPTNSDSETLALARQNAATLAALSRTSAGHHLYVALIVAGLAAVGGALLFGRRTVLATPSASLQVQ